MADEMPAESGQRGQRRAPEGIGRRRLVVGAHYGLSAWLLQRITAAVLALYLLFLLGTALAVARLDYDGWAGLFAPVWMKLVTLIALGALFYHAWVGIRDIWMDYVKPVGARLGLQVATGLFLLYCAAWSVQILWSV
jgi:succinate dehydrogenase / fumarate reductase membrane anchor subunit